VNRLDGKTAIVTGASSGIGEATARLFAQEGSTVILAARSVEKGNKIAAEINAQGGKALFIKCDIGEEADTDNLVRAVIEKYGKIDILVNNAAAGGGPGYLTHEFDKERRDYSFRVNVFGTMSLSKAVIPHMLRAKKGSIVNVASIGAELAVPRDSIYAATKGAIRQLTKTMAVEYAASGIRVNAVLPGLTRTGMIPEGGSDLEKRILPKIPMGRIAQPVEIAYGILFLASDEASFCTGMTMVMDGGETCN